LEVKKRMLKNAQDKIQARRNMSRILLLAVLIIGVVLSFIYAYPFYIVIIAALGANIYIRPPEFFPSVLRVEAFIRILTNPGFNIWVINSLIYSLCTTFGILLVCAPAAYALSRMEFRGRAYFFWLVLAMLMFPLIVIYVPLYILLSRMQLLNTYPGYILPILASPYVTFFLKQTFDSIPKDYEEAAFIDGAGRLYITFRIFFPLVRPAILTISFLQFIAQWNNLAWPLFVATSPQMWNLPLAIWNLSWSYSRDYWIIGAGGTILFLLPLIMLILASETILRGLVVSGLKG